MLSSPLGDPVLETNDLLFCCLLRRLESSFMQTPSLSGQRPLLISKRLSRAQHIPQALPLGLTEPVGALSWYVVGCLRKLVRFCGEESCKLQGTKLGNCHVSSRVLCKSVF